jgi:hypothetical protein
MRIAYKPFGVTRPLLDGFSSTPSRKYGRIVQPMAIFWAKNFEDISKSSIFGPPIMGSRRKYVRIVQLIAIFGAKNFEDTDTLRVPPRNITGVIPKNQKGLRPNFFDIIIPFMQA